MKERIIELLNENTSLTIMEINDKLLLNTIEEYQRLENTLDELVSEGILYYSERKNKYLLLENSHLVKGDLILNDKGFGFIEIDKDAKDVYVNEKNRTTTQEDTPIVAFISIFYILTAGISLFLLLIGNLYIILTPYYRKRCYPIIRYCTFRDECFEYMAFNSDMLGIILALYFSFIPVRQEFLENYHRIV